MNKTALFLSLFLATALAYAEDVIFSNGPTIKNFGINAEIAATWPMPEKPTFKVAFDVAGQADIGEVNQKFNSLARFINMHTRAGVSPDDIQLALVVHGKALHDLLQSQHYKRNYDSENANIELVQELIKNRVQVIVCGQSAAYYKVAQEDFIPGVKVALSAMTAHAILQQQGYTSNPF